IKTADESSIRLSLDDLPRVATVLQVVPGLEDLAWFGTGPHETYPDRKRSGLLGVHRSTVMSQTVPYIRPRENGGHADVRWRRLRGPAGSDRAVRMSMDPPAQ